MIKLEVAQLIKDAFEEGYASYASPCESYNTVTEAWNESSAKEVHDYLINGDK